MSLLDSTSSIAKRSMSNATSQPSKDIDYRSRRASYSNPVLLQTAEALQPTCWHRRLHSSLSFGRYATFIPFHSGRTLIHIGLSRIQSSQDSRSSIPRRSCRSEDKKSRRVLWPTKHGSENANEECTPIRVKADEGGRTTTADPIMHGKTQSIP